MAQGNMNIADGSGAEVLTELDTAFAALQSWQKGNTDPATAGYAVVAGTWWMDTGNMLVKQRNSNNDTWVIRGKIRDDGTIQWEETEVTLASAATLAIGAADGETILVTGTTEITAFDSPASGNPRRILIFKGALTVAYSASAIILPGSENISVTAGDIMEFVYNGSGIWECVNYLPTGGYVTESSLDTKVSALVSSQLSSYAPLASPAFTGTPTTPTLAQFDTSTQIANGASVMAAAGAVRGVLSISANHTLTAAENGKAIIATTGGITIGTPTLPFPNAHFTIMNNASTAISFVSTLGTNIIYGEFGWGLSSISIPAYSTLDLYCDGISWLTKSLSKYSASITGSYPGYRVIDPVTRLMVQFGITGTVSTGATLTTSFPASFNAIAYPPIITAYNGGTISLDGDNGPLIVTNWSLSSFTVKSTDDANAYSCNYIVFGI